MHGVQGVEPQQMAPEAFTNLEYFVDCFYTWQQ